MHWISEYRATSVTGADESTVSVIRIDEATLKEAIVSVENRHLSTKLQGTTFQKQSY